MRKCIKRNNVNYPNVFILLIIDKIFQISQNINFKL